MMGENQIVGKYYVRTGNQFDIIFIQGFAHEGAVHSVINHPDVINRIDHGVGLIGPFPADALLTELVYRDTMFDMIDRVIHHLELEQTQANKRDLFNRIVKLIDFLRVNNILHCDLKPENILLSPDRRQFKLIDFGLAQIGAIQSPYVINNLLQPAYYLAPELHQGQIAHSVETEVFALGCLLFCLLFNMRPFPMALPTDHFYSHIYNGNNAAYWAMIEHIKGPINANIKNLLSSMFAENPQQRPTLQNIINAVW